MRLTMTLKYVGTLFGALITCCAVVLCIAIYFMKKPIDEELQAQIGKMRNVIQTANDQTASRFAQGAMLASHNAELADAIVARDHEKVMRLSKEAMAESGSDFMTVTDDKGIVVGRGHSAKHQDSVLNQETVVKALKGEPAVAIVSGTVVPYTIRASQPISKNGKLVGTMSIGASLVTPPYLDGLKKMSGAEITIFKGDTRVMTTLMKDGKRNIGTKINSPEIEEAVLRQGKTLYTRNTINDIPYEAAYWPMRTADGAISGMWFVGIPLDNLQKSENNAIFNTIMFSLLLLLLQLIVSIFIGMRVSAPVRKITNYVMAVAKGDKDARLDVHGNDDMGELANALRGMVGRQDQLIAENKDKADAANRKADEAKQMEEQARAAHEEAIQARHKGMSAAASELENVVTSLNDSIGTITSRVEQTDGALKQVSSNLAGTSTAMEEMNSTVLEVAKNVGLAANISAAAREKATVGAETVLRSVAGIQEVHNQSMALKKDMEKLGEHARSIDTIMSVISDIADQTNLLALNAAIEAARAGEAGRGFAVVADEVRKLAEKTMQSTSEVGSAIQAIQQSAEHSGRQVDQAVRNIAQANESSEQSGKILQEILDLVEQTADEVRAIAAASEQQAASSEEITRSIHDINELTISTSDAMQTAAGGLESLRERSHELVGLIDHMKKG